MPPDPPPVNSRELSPPGAPAPDVSRVLDTGGPAVPAVSPEAFLGRELAGYRIEEFVGAGGFSMVFRATHRASGDAVALKLPRVPEFVEHLRREALIATRFNDPHVVALREVRLNHDPPFVVMPYIEGRNLLLPSEPPPPAEIVRAFDTFRQVAAVVSRMHAAGVVHGDLKPGNVRFDAAGKCHLLDLGLARQQVHVRQVSTLRASVHSVTGEKIAGTLEFMAPEVMTGEKPGMTADVYALGVILHHMLCGRPPAFGVSPSDLNPYLPPGLASFLRAALHHDPALRHPSAIALLPGLDGFIEEEKRCLARRDGHGRRRVALERMKLVGRGLHVLFWFVAFLAVVVGVVMLTPAGMAFAAHPDPEAKFALVPAAVLLGLLGALLGVTTLNAWIFRVPAEAYKKRLGHRLWSFMMQ